MDGEDIQTLFEYHTWANRRILEAAAGVSQEQFDAPAEFPYGGLRGTLVHLLGAEWLWRTRLQEGVSPQEMPLLEDFPNLESVSSRLEGEDAALGAYLDSLEEGDLDRTVQYKTTKGKPYTNVAWNLLFQLVNHSTQHRSEAAVLLTRYGRSPDDLDFIVFLREKEAG